MLLSGNKGIALPKLKQEILNVGQYCTLQFRFSEIEVARKAEELCYNGILNKLVTVGLEFSGLFIS